MRPSSGFCTRRSVRVMDTVTLQCWTAQIRNSGVAPAAERLRETAENSGLRRNGDKDFEMQSGKRAPENARRHEGQWAHDLTSPRRPSEGRRPKPLTQSAAWPLSVVIREKTRPACHQACPLCQCARGKAAFSTKMDPASHEASSLHESPARWDKSEISNKASPLPDELRQGKGSHGKTAWGGASAPELPGMMIMHAADSPSHARCAAAGQSDTLCLRHRESAASSESRSVRVRMLAAEEPCRQASGHLTHSLFTGPEKTRP